MTTAHRHNITPSPGMTPFTSTTRYILDWLAEHGLTPFYGKGWDHPPTLCIEFGVGSGWLWGNLTISSQSGRVVHLKAAWTGPDGTQHLDTADGPTAIRAELERHAGHRVERITQLAARHGLLALPTTPDALDTAAAALRSYQRTKLIRALRTAATTHNIAMILDTTRRVLRDQAPGRTPVGVLFTTLDYGAGHTLIEQGTAVFADGTTEDFDFIPLDEPFAEEFGRIGATFTLAVDLRTGTLDPQADFQGSLHQRFLMPEPADSTR